MGFSPFNSQPYGTGFTGFNNPMGGGLASPQPAFGTLLNMMMSVMAMMSQMFMVNQMNTMVSPAAQFGAQGGSRLSPGLGNFLGGGGSPAGMSSAGAMGGSSAPVATSSDFGAVPAWGAALAKDAEKNANGPGGYCFKWVRQALERAGVKGVGGASAYMAADQLAKNPRFREIQVAPKDLPKLPAGAVVVWDRGGSGASSAGKIHGHISISLGDGREVSDRIRNQTTSMGSKVRVFLPK
ncbi:MAG: hypothetical protein KC800_18445 [Candidatus Eremiobacteraeota bacterium]|nr:hypothetical protein [Candidatus Eremiobacteraeota bacterium]